LAPGQRYLRGLFSGGTLAYEAQYILESYIPKMYANAPLRKENKLPNALISQEHTIVDLGEDEFTVGRLHPMMDNDLRIRRLLEEAQDPSVAVIMLDVCHRLRLSPQPRQRAGTGIVKARALAEKAGRYLEVAAVVTGTDEDPQNFDEQIRLLKDGRRLGQSQQRRYGPLHWSHPPGFGPGFSVPGSALLKHPGQPGFLQKIQPDVIARVVFCRVERSDGCF